MNNAFYFLITIHFHQPIGNFDHVIEKACEKCYEPFLDTIEKFPEIKFNLHYSGCLLEWMKNNRPKILAKVKKLIKNGQIELLGGGFFEPILPPLSSEDSIEQIQMFSEFLKDEFGVKISGAWLTERVWEPHLAKIFNTAGIKYTIVDDTHFRYSGLQQNQLYGYYLTEENGKTLSIFPSDKFLRYAIPFHPQQETIDYFQKIKNEYQQNCVLYGDDGEKFGEWPGTYDWVYNKKWLVNFLSTLRENYSCLKTVKISEYMEQEAPQGRIYLPTASYQEMSEWSLPAEAGEKFENLINEVKSQGQIDKFINFLRGGFWRNFLVKYPESNQMQKRMLFISQRLRKLKKPKDKTTETKFLEAKKELFRGQCNCAYWHGVFGGLYLYHLRSAIYKHLINANGIIDAIEHKNQSFQEIHETDFDADGHNEFIIETNKDAFIINPAEGASLTEWDVKEKSLNIINTLSRRKEAYHHKLKELAQKNATPGSPATIHDTHFTNQAILSKELYYDNYRRVSFLDHFLNQDVTLQQLKSNLYQENGDFTEGIYHKAKIGKTSISFEKEGLIHNLPVKIAKEFHFSSKENKLCIKYEILNLSKQAFEINFAPELNFSLTQDDIEETVTSLDSIIIYDKIEKLAVNANFSEKVVKLFRFTIATVSQSEKDIEENYQATCIIPLFSFVLNKNGAKKIDIELIAKSS